MSERKITVICPVCGRSGRIPVPVDVIQKKETGATSVFIPAGMICEDAFYAYVDKNFDVRDYLVLEFSLMDEEKKVENLKNDILRRADEFNITYSNIMKFISEDDLRVLLFGGFIRSPFLLIENETDSERFCVLFTYLAKIFPDVARNAKIFHADKFLEYNDEHKEKLKKYTIYNVAYKLVVQKPFSSITTEPLEFLFDMIKKTPPKLQIVYAKNFFDYLSKFAEEIKVENLQKTEKIQKVLRKKYPRQAEYFTPELIQLMRDRNESVEKLEKPEGEAEIVLKLDDKTLFMYNDDTHIRQAEMLPDILEKHTLRTLRKEKTITLKHLIDELRKIAAEQLLKFDYSRVPDILDEFVMKGYIMKL
ncbi:MAG: hypothetical protein DRO88_01990 [Promethearchaeia archaeon]|nr:MAG: hypothetical protein DRO88_01990 [Candidatus Lokiarchaeia archaeon]